LVLLLFDDRQQVVLIKLVARYFAALVKDKLYYLSGVQWVSATVVRHSTVGGRRSCCRLAVAPNPYSVVGFWTGWELPNLDDDGSARRSPDYSGRKKQRRTLRLGS
jgi:hypothetical protein